MKTIKEVKLPCIYCGQELTDEEKSLYFKDSVYCCDGHMCGCMGFPIDPPICNKCVEKLNKELEME